MGVMTAKRANLNANQCQLCINKQNFYLFLLFCSSLFHKYHESFQNLSKEGKTLKLSSKQTIQTTDDASPPILTVKSALTIQFRAARSLPKLNTTRCKPFGINTAGFDHYYFFCGVLSRKN